MNNKIYRKKNGVKEKDRCYLCNNKAQKKCRTCKDCICNDCDVNGYCYKCNTINLDVTKDTLGYG